MDYIVLYSPGQNTGVGSLSLLQGNLSNSGIEPTSPALLGGLFTTEPAGKPKLIVTKGKMGGKRGKLGLTDAQILLYIK